MTAFRMAMDTTTWSVVIDGRTINVPAGATVAGALLLAGKLATGLHPLTGEPLGPHCLMGVCFDCLVEIDGVPDRQACLVAVRPGMIVRTRQGGG
ncbi:MAG: (2Fe-2S)-binding protein [Pseudomonadota bacterium]